MRPTEDDRQLGENPNPQNMKPDYLKREAKLRLSNFAEFVEWGEYISFGESQVEQGERARRRLGLEAVGSIWRYRISVTPFIYQVGVVAFQQSLIHDTTSPLAFRTARSRSSRLGLV